MKDFNQNIVLETKDLYLRYLALDDKQAIFNNINNDKEVLKYYVTNYADNIEDFYFERMLNSFIETQKYIFAIVLKQNNEVIGNILQCNNPFELMNSVELGYAIGKKYWNKGYMSQALKAMIDFMFKNGVHKVWSCHIEDNIASGVVMKKCGMIFEGVRKDDLYYHDKYWDTLVYYIINGEEL